MSELQTDKAVWQVAGQSLQVMVPLLLVLAVVMWMFYRTNADVEQTVTRADEQYVLQLASQVLNAELRTLRDDVLYLSEHALLRHWLDAGGSSSLADLQADLRAFARHRKAYDQIRFIDDQGRERLRVNWDGGHSRVVPVDQLQNKSGRYYVEQALRLERGAIYHSPFDLNLENGVIEQPLKPMIRLATPVFDSKGEKRGFIMLNYLGQHLLDRLRQSSKKNGARIWLLNSEGYWLLGPDPAVEWAFMYPDRAAARFEHQYPDVWASMQRDPQRDQFENTKGLFTYARFTPVFSADRGEEHWFVVTHVPAAVLAANTAGRVRDLAWVFVVLMLLLVITSGVIAHNDIQRRRTMKKVGESEQRFRGLLNSAPDAIVIVAPSGFIELVNTQTENWFGYSREELVGQPVEILIPERYHGTHHSHRKAYKAAPQVRPMGAERDLYGRRKDGSEFPVEISLSPLQTDQGVLVTSIIRDVTARRQAEESERQVRARYKELVDNLPVGVYRNTPGPHGRFIEINPAVISMFEADSAEQMLGTSVSSLYCDPNDRNVFNEKIMSQGFVTGEELRLKTLRGTEFYAAITSVVKKDINGNIYFDGIVEDISERKQSELRIRQLNENLTIRSTELEAINHELEAFSYSVSHDLRAPLRAMDGFSRTLLDQYAEQIDERGRDRLNRIRAAAQRMALLIDDLLNLSRVSRSDIYLKRVDMTALANTVIKELQENEPGRQVQFIASPGLVVEADARLVKVLLSNLLGNAWKFTALRSEPIVEFGRSGESAVETYFIRDNGAGFDMAYAGKLFGAFQRLHDASEFPGTGIGLATAQRVINKHGGRIWAEGTVGQGATFYFTLKKGHGYD